MPPNARACGIILSIDDKSLAPFERACIEQCSQNWIRTVVQKNSAKNYNFSFISFPAPTHMFAYEFEAKLLEKILQFALDKVDNAVDLLILDLSCYLWRALSFDTPLFMQVIGSFQQTWFFNKEQTPISSSRNVGTCLTSDNKFRIAFLDTAGRFFMPSVEREAETLPKKQLSKPEIKFSFEDFARFVQWKCGTHVGHFALPGGTHISTFYDLEEIVRNPSALQFLERSLREIHVKERIDLVIGYGICRDGLSTLLGHIGRVFNVRTLLFRPGDDAHLTEALQPPLKYILVITDGISTAATISQFVSTLKRQIVTNSLSDIPRLCVISAVGRQPAPKQLLDDPTISISYAAELPTTTLEGLVPCVSCSIGNAPQELQHLDRFPVFPKRPSPFDFWSMIENCAGLDASKRFSPNRDKLYFLYIDTARVFSTYLHTIAAWLAFICLEKGGRALADTVVCTDEEPAMALAHSIAPRLGIHLRRVFLLNRIYFDRSTPAGISESSKEKLVHFRGRKVLIIDDGTNTLQTYNKMSRVLRSAGATIGGFAVFLNRLSATDHEVLQQELGDRFFFYYHWPVPPRRAG